MVYLILSIGVLIGAYALYKYFLRADAQAIRHLIRNSLLTLFILILLFLALTGRLPIAIALVIGAIPFLYTWLRGRFFNKARRTETQDVIDVEAEPADEDERKK